MPYKVTQMRILLADRSHSHAERQLLRGFHALAGERNWLVLNVQASALVPAAIKYWDPHVCVVSPSLLSEVPRRVWGDHVLIGMNVNAPDRPIASAHPDDIAVGAKAAEHLLAKGFRNFATFQIDSYAWSRARVRGFREVVEAGGGNYVGDGITTAPLLDQPADIAKWARALPAGTAILACCDGWGATLLQGVSDQRDCCSGGAGGDGGRR